MVRTKHGRGADLAIVPQDDEERQEPEELEQGQEQEREQAEPSESAWDVFGGDDDDHDALDADAEDEDADDGDASDEYNQLVDDFAADDDEEIGDDSEIDDSDVVDDSDVADDSDVVVDDSDVEPTDVDDSDVEPIVVDGPDAVPVEIVDDEAGEADEPADTVTPEAAAESLYQKKLRDAEQEYSEACLELAELEDTLASTKEEIKSQKEVCHALAGKLRTIKRQGEVQLDLSDQPLLNKKSQDNSATDGGRQDDAASGAGGGAEGTSEPAGSASDQDTAGAVKDDTGTASSSASSASPAKPQPKKVNLTESWAAVPTNLLGLEEIKGLGAKKLEAILDECPTLGKLEAVRGGEDGLMSLPGVGRKMADAIEEVILNWLSRNRDAEVLNAAADGANEVAKRGQQIEQRLDEIRQLNDLHPKPGFEGAFESGRIANGTPDYEATDCPWLPGDQQDAWLMGWVTAEGGD